MPGKNQLDDVTIEEPQENLPAVAAQWSDTVTLSAEDLVIPYLTLAQGLHPQVADGHARMGQWLVEGYEAMDSVVIVPLRFGVSRRLSVLVGSENVTKCYSATGTGFGIGDPGIQCAECPMADWQPTDEITADGRKKNAPPPCKESYDFMAWSVDHGTLVKVGFKSTGMKTGRLLATLGKTKGLGNFAVRLASVKAAGAKFSYVQPTATILSGPQAEEAIVTGREMLALP